MSVANVLHAAMWIVKTVKNVLLEESITLFISPASFCQNRQRHLALKTQIMTALTTCPVSILQAC